MKRYFVYMMSSSRNGTLYCGVTNNLTHRAWEHRNRTGACFTSKYDVNMLVWYEEHGDIRNAIHRETQIKRWRRAWKLALIESFNPQWRDLYDDLLPGPLRTYERPPMARASAPRQWLPGDDPMHGSFDFSERT